MDLYRQANEVASDSKHTRWLSPLLLLADSGLCALIVWKIPCELALWKYRQTKTLYKDPELTLRRYRDRLGCLHATDLAIS